MKNHSIDTSALHNIQKTSKAKSLKPEDREAANRAYAIYMAKHDESMMAVREFQEKNPGKAIPDGMKITQTSVAESVGWTQGNLSQYLTGAVPIREKALQKLCEALGCNPWDIRPETLSDTDLLEQNQKLVEQVNTAERLNKELEEQLSGILSALGELEGTHTVVDKILKEKGGDRKAA